MKKKTTPKLSASEKHFMEIASHINTGVERIAKMKNQMEAMKKNGPYANRRPPEPGVTGERGLKKVYRFKKGGGPRLSDKLIDQAVTQYQLDRIKENSKFSSLADACKT